MDLAVESYVEQSARADNLGEFVGWLVGKAPVFAHHMIGQRWDVGNLDSYHRAEAWLQARQEESGRLAGRNDP